MPRSYPPEMRRQVIELARSGTRVKQLALTFAISEATVYNWTKQDEMNRGEREGVSTDQAIELMAAKRRIKQLETELAVTSCKCVSLARGGVLLQWSASRGRSSCSWLGGSATERREPFSR